MPYSSHRVLNKIRSETTRTTTGSRWQLKHLHAESPPVTQRPAKFNGCKSCVNNDVIFLSVTLPHVDHVIEGSYGFKGASFLG